MKTYYREEDGQTYFIRYSETCDINLCACPTFDDGKPDYQNYVYVSDFDEPLTAEVEAEIKKNLEIA